MSAPFCTYKRKEKNGIFTGNKLESIAGIESNMGWDSDYATGASADSCWFLFAGDFQSQETFRKISHGEF